MHRCLPVFIPTYGFSVNCHSATRRITFCAMMLRQNLDYWQLGHKYKLQLPLNKIIYSKVGSMTRYLFKHARARRRQYQSSNRNLPYLSSPELHSQDTSSIVFQWKAKCMANYIGWNYANQAFHMQLQKYTQAADAPTNGSSHPQRRLTRFKVTW